MKTAEEFWKDREEEVARLSIENGRPTFSPYIDLLKEYAILVQEEQIKLCFKTAKDSLSDSDIDSEWYFKNCDRVIE